MRYAQMLTALVAASSFSLSAQSPPSPPASVRVGQSVTGRLVQTDRKFSDGSLYRMYTVAGNKGEAIALDLTSDDFDANLLIADASGNTLARNDDGGGSCNARLTFVPPATGTYRVYANSSAPAELGEYRLTLASGSGAVAADTVCHGFGRVAGMVEVGRTVSGDLTSDDPEFNSDSTYFQRWILPVRANQTFTVDLESSEFDAYVMLTRGRGEKLVENDDGGGACNARLVYTTQDDHPLRIVVNSASRPRRQTGHFVLRVTQGESATEPKSNCRLNTAAAVGTTSLIRQVSNVSDPSATAAIAVVRVGETINGRLTSSDSLYPDNSYVQYYQFTATPGQQITIDLSSDDFDPVLIIRGDDLERSIIDDDGGPGCSSRVSRTFPSAGPYRILVNTTASPERQTGSFSLSITQGAKPVQQSGNSDCRTRGGNTDGGGGGGSVTAHSIEIGQAREGTLTRTDVLLHSDSTYAQPWAIQGRVGQTITIDLESDDFDSYVFLRGPGITGGRDFQDDDSGGNCNARLTATFPQNGDYEIDVNSTNHYATGSFTLSVTTGSKPKSVARCNRSNQ
ncbi:MAG TPA: hypothetical protein VGU74_07535 [Gemmatimonadales bacterium]|nr:hypothetical protein [Gemmatimonadales bacterium]